MLTSCIPKPELDCLFSSGKVDDVVVENGGDIVLREAVVGVRDEKA